MGIFSSGDDSRAEHYGAKFGESFGKHFGEASGKAIGNAMGKAMDNAGNRGSFDENYEFERFKFKARLVIFCLILIGIGVFLFVTRFLPLHKGIKNPVYTIVSSRSYSGQNNDVALSDFENAGFTNIEMHGLGDLVTGWINHDGEIDSVTIEGDSFIEGEQFAQDAHVVITYHSFEPENVLYQRDDDLGIYWTIRSFNRITFGVPEQWFEATDLSKNNYILYCDAHDVSMANNALFILIGGPELDTSMYENDYIEWFRTINNVDEADVICISESTLGGRPALYFEAFFREYGYYSKMYIVDYGSTQAVFGFEYYEEDESVELIFNKFIESIEF